MKRAVVMISALVMIPACADIADEYFGQGEGNVTGTWTASMPRSVFHGDETAGVTTSFTLTVEQSGTHVMGTESFTDTGGRTGSTAVTGTFIGTRLSYTRQDFDPQCGGRQITSLAPVFRVTPGSTMMVGYGAEAAGDCPPLADSILYTKR